MSTFTVAVTRTVAEKALPTGVIAFGSTVVSLLNAADNSVAHTATVTDGSLLTSFSGVIEGAYIAQAQDLDSTGANLGDAVQVPFTVSETPPAATTYQASASLAVNVTPDPVAPAADAGAAPAAS